MSNPNSNMLEFRAMDAEQLTAYTSMRSGETKLGQVVQSEITQHTRFVILGICEDIGPRANMGNGGATNAFDAFLSKFLNMQSNRFLNGETVSIIGSIHARSESSELSLLREKVAELDDLVIEILLDIDFANTTKDRYETIQLIVIGGGHNNAYPIMKALSLQFPELNILNIDPHADCRPLEGRHSGNPFSTALTEEIIASYTVLGLHQQYNSPAIYSFLDDNKCTYSFFDDYLDGKSLSDDISTFLDEKSHSFGIEIDLDAIEYMPTSAFTPSGFPLNEIRSAVRRLAESKPVYLHLPEGSPQTNEEKTIVGKALAYLVSDFIKKVTN